MREEEHAAEEQSDVRRSIVGLLGLFIWEERDGGPAVLLSARGTATEKQPQRSSELEIRDPAEFIKSIFVPSMETNVSMLSHSKDYRRLLPHRQQHAGVRVRVRVSSCQGQRQSQA